MLTTTKWTLAASLAGLTVFGVGMPEAKAQFRQRTLPVYSSGVSPRSPFYNPLSPTFRVAPGLSSQQALFNNYQALRAAASLPPWLYGYNPYPNPIISTGPVVPYPVPVVSNPFVNPYTAYSSNPWLFSPSVYGNPYAFSVNPFGSY
jgi:hypothetical protein